MHELFRVHESSQYNMSSNGKKPPPSALRAHIIKQQEGEGDQRGAGELGEVGELLMCCCLGKSAGVQSVRDR